MLLTTRLSISPARLLQNYLLGRKETCEMAERNKEALLEVSLFSPPAPHSCFLACIFTQKSCRNPEASDPKQALE